MGRTPCCDKIKVKRGPWSPQEDTLLQNFVQTHGSAGNWISLPQKAGLKRCGKSCRLRWLNYLRPDIKHGGFTHEEDNFILTLYLTIGSRWSVIASHLQGRTDNDVKNYWNTKLKKKLAQHMHSRRAAAAATTTNRNIVPSSNISMLLPPKPESNYDYETTEHPFNVINLASTTSFPYPTGMNYDQEELGRPKTVVQISDTKDPMSKINVVEEEVVIDQNGTSYTAFSRSHINTSHRDNYTDPIAVSPTFSLENSDYASWSGEGFLDRFGYFQEEINDQFGNFNVDYS